MEEKQSEVFSKRHPVRLTTTGFLFVCLLLCVLAGTFFYRSSSGTSTRETLKTNPPSLYWGVYQPGMVSYRSDVSPLSTFEATVNKKVSIVEVFQLWGDPTTQNFNPVFMNAVRSHGSIPLLTWDSAANPLIPDQPEYSLQNIINGDFDAYITNFARAAKAWGHPFFLRLDQEMDLGWAPWDETYQGESINGNQPGQYVAMWRHVHDIFAKVGATNVTWVWCPSRIASLATYRELYPGNAFVNWLSTDVYNMPNAGGAGTFIWKSFNQLFSQAYANLLQVAVKPIILAETGSVEDIGNARAKADWITDMLATQLPENFPDVKAFVWWNVSPQTSIESSPSSLLAFTKAVQSPLYAMNTYSSLKSSLILPLSKTPAPAVLPTLTPTKSPTSE